MPPLTTLAISSVPSSYAKLPSMPKIVNPAIKLVSVSKLVIIITSLKTMKKKKLVININTHYLAHL